MKNKLLLFFILGAAIGGNLFVLPTSPAAAQTQTNANEYTVLAPLPGTTLTPDCVGNNCKTTLEKYLPGVFNLLIGLAAASAVLRIVWGGFLYMSTDALQGKEDGKAQIWNSVKGLVLVIGAWLILNTINPSLLTLRLQVDPVNIPVPAGGRLSTGSGSGAGRVMTDAEVTASDAIRAALAGNTPNQAFVGVYTGPCKFGQPSGCVNLNGLQQSTIAGVLALRSEFGQFINITGGTETSIHAPGGDHPAGKALDFGRNSNLENYEALSTFIRNKDSTPTQNRRGEMVYTFQLNGREVQATKELSPDHWHIVFN